MYNKEIIHENILLYCFMYNLKSEWYYKMVEEMNADRLVQLESLSGQQLLFMSWDIEERLCACFNIPITVAANEPNTYFY